MRIDIAHIRRMADAIATTDDRDSEPGFLDTLEGETEAVEIADWLIGSILADEAMADALKAQEAAMKARRDRIEARAKAKRRAGIELLNAAGLKKLERPRATLSRTAGRTSVQITDEASVPTQLCTVKTVTTPDKAAIKRQIEAGETVPGAELVRGDDALTMRVA